MSKFYSWRQNNSGGFYLFDTMTVIVEADNLEEARKIAYRESEVYEGMGPNDCDCCGGRWFHPWSDDCSEASVGVESWEEARRKKIRIIRK